MNRMDFVCENWQPNESVPPLRTATRMILRDFRGEARECWHLRARGWRWVSLRSCFPGLTVGQEYELSFWAKFDYYSGMGTQCFIDLYDAGQQTEHRHYDINPNSPYAAASSGDWVLYRLKVEIAQGEELAAEIVSFEANVAIMKAGPEDEKDAAVIPVQHNGDIAPFTINNELPFQEYSSLEQRIVKYYSELQAPYHPCTDIPEISQSEYYGFVKETYDRLYAEPEGFFPKLHEDDAHPNRFNNTQYGRPELKRRMKSDQAKLEELFTLILELAKIGEAAAGGIHISADIGKKQRTLLSYLGFKVTNGILVHEKYKNIGDAILYLAGKEKALWSLMYCWFEDSYPYLEKTFAKHYDKKQFERLTGWLYENGYRMQVGAGSSPTLDYYKGVGKKETPVGYALFGDKNHYGFTFEFHAEPRGMQHCELRIIQFANMLKSFDELTENTQSLIRQRTKRCDGCRYCVQTDKTGRRPFAAITIRDGITLCPYYPGFYYVYERLLEHDTDCIRDFLTDLERQVINRG